MCGIFGGIPELIRPDAAELLRHRGPNQQGQVLVQSRLGRQLVLGTTRLSVVDQHEVPTPFGRFDAVLCYNGEVYNWRSIRHDLEVLGQHFETQTDTEVILAAYLQWGPACLDRFNGMFALAIWHDGKLFLARDRLGKKPLFYTHTGQGFGFASELKAIRDLAFEEVPICRSLEFHFDEFTPFRNVKSVKPGEYLIYDPDSNHKDAVRWWTFPAFSADLADPKVAVKEFLSLFEDACNVRRLADVPITIFLSGGVDSSLIQAVLKFDVSYTVQFEEFRNHINEQVLVEEFARAFSFESRVVTPNKEESLRSHAASNSRSGV
jgi:asparagine synthase (glutamine-hydrolysing)